MSPSEDEIAEAVLEHWLTFWTEGSLVASIPNKRAWGQAGLTPGLPDLLVVTPALAPRVGFIELKRDSGRRSEAQIAIGDLLTARGIPYAVTYGRDQPIDVLESWGAVRKRASSGHVERQTNDPGGVSAGASPIRAQLPEGADLAGK